MKYFCTLVTVLMASSYVAAVPVANGDKKLNTRLDDKDNNGGLLSSLGLGALSGGADAGGVGDGLADLLQGAVGAAGGIAGDIVNTPGDAISNLVGLGQGNKARAAEATDEEEEEEECQDDDEE